ncbi:Lysine-specific demethylase 3B [Coemansia sp. RSA 1365]|nr:Lysine-specific demethylase 3B [Coemansia sp. RSA 1365]
MVLTKAHGKSWALLKQKQRLHVLRQSSTQEQQGQSQSDKNEQSSLGERAGPNKRAVASIDPTREDCEMDAPPKQIKPTASSGCHSKVVRTRPRTKPIVFIDNRFLERRKRAWQNNNRKRAKALKDSPPSSMARKPSTPRKRVEKPNSDSSAKMSLPQLKKTCSTSAKGEVDVSTQPSEAADHEQKKDEMFIAVHTIIATPINEMHSAEIPSKESSSQSFSIDYEEEVVLTQGKVAKLYIDAPIEHSDLTPTTDMTEFENTAGEHTESIENNDDMEDVVMQTCLDSGISEEELALQQSMPDGMEEDPAPRQSMLDGPEEEPASPQLVLASSEEGPVAYQSILKDPEEDPALRQSMLDHLEVESLSSLSTLESLEEEPLAQQLMLDRPDDKLATHLSKILTGNMLPTTNPVLDEVCAALPSPETVCSPDFEFEHLKASIYEPVHTLASPRGKNTHTQAIFEYKVGDFLVPEDPLLWRSFQQMKYSRWAELHPSCLRATVRLLPQQTGCISVSKQKQPLCRACISRVGGKPCRFADVRYTTRLTIELTNGTTAVRYLICPIFRSQIDKSPAIRQVIPPIMLPEHRVVDGDDSWIEFHVLCQTVSAIKSLLRRELAVVRDVRISEARGISNGCISFHDTETLPKAVLDENANAVHPIYGCAPSPCILRKVPFGAHQRCDTCAAAIFSTYFSCCLCMKEICVECFSTWEDSDITERCSLYEKGAKAGTNGKNDSDHQSSISHCKRFTFEESGEPTTYRTLHKKCQFVRVSHFSECELEMMLRKVNRVVQYCDLLDETQPAGYSSISLCANALKISSTQSRKDYTWTSSILDRIDCDTEVIASLGDADFGADPTLRPESKESCTGLETSGAGPSKSQSHYLEAQWDAKIRSLLLSQHFSLQEWQRPPVYVPADDITLREFSRLWEEGYIVVVTGLINKLDEQIWNPDALLRVLGKLSTPIYEASGRRSALGDWPLTQFLQLFNAKDFDVSGEAEGESDERRKKLLATRLRACINLGCEMDSENPKVDPDQWQDLRNSASGILPVSQYTSANGQLNLANRLPGQYTRPEFGPEIQFTYGTKESGTVENLRCEFADMVNVMMYASPADQALPSIVKSDAAVPSRRKSRSRQHIQETESADSSHGTVWDIYPLPVVDQLREFLQEEAPSLSSKSDIVHNQQLFMNDRWCEELFERYGDDAKCFRVYQNVGDAVFVPSGYLYQRRIFNNTICVQSKFLGPEHTAAAHRLSRELTTNCRNMRRKEALPVMDILWWTWMRGFGQHDNTANVVISSKKPRGVRAHDGSNSTPVKRQKNQPSDSPARSSLHTNQSQSEPKKTRGRGRGRGQSRGRGLERGRGQRGRGRGRGRGRLHRNPEISD